MDPLSRRQFWELIDRIRARRAGMSVVVATAYMEEAEGFDWLVAMDSGNVLATGSAAELKTTTGTDGLEEAFIALLPEAKRAGHRVVVVPPRVAADDTVAIEAVDLTKRFGKFTAVDHVSFRIQRGEIFGFLGFERLRQDYDDANAHWPHAGDRRYSETVWPTARRERPRDTQSCRFHVAKLFPFIPSSRSCKTSSSTRSSIYVPPGKIEKTAYDGIGRTIRARRLSRRYWRRPCHSAFGNACRWLSQ